MEWTDHGVRLWTGFLFWVTRRLFALRFEVEGQDSLAPGPIVLFCRHASIVDVLLPYALATHLHGLRMRYVFKKELAWDPCLDIGGRRTKSYFVDRNARNRAREIESIRKLAQNLESRDGVAFYPEGTRFTREKQARLLARLATRNPIVFEGARHYRHVLPPHPGGSLALLDAGVDVVFCAHQGFDGLARVRDILSGDLTGRTIRVRLWRAEACEIPRDREERMAWLCRQWQLVDDWIDRAKEPVHTGQPRLQLLAS